MNTLSTQSDPLSLLDWLYDKSLSGIGIMESAYSLANEYKTEYSDMNTAIEALISNESWKAASSGFLSGLGGIISSTVLLPANVTSVLYIQVRMVMTIAILRGYPVNYSKVKWLILGCLCGETLSQLFKNVCANHAIQMLGKANLSIMAKAIMRYVSTKIIAKSSTVLIKGIPLVGGLVGGSIDYGMTKSVAKTARQVFRQANNTQLLTD